MTCTKSLLCPECWEEVDATDEIRHHVEQVRGVTVEADIEHYVCPKCGESIGWAPIVDKGLHKLYHAYQEKMGLMLPEEIVALRKNTGSRSECSRRFSTSAWPACNGTSGGASLPIPMRSC